MVDKVADRAALFLWHALHWLSVLLLVLLLAVVVAGVLPPEVPTAGSGPALEATQSTAMDVPPEQAAPGSQPESSPAALASAMAAPGSATPSPTWTSVPLTSTPIVPSLPHAGQASARANAEAVLALASQGRWQGPRATATPTTTATALLPPPPTPTPLPTEPMGPPAQPPARIVAPTIGLDAKIVPVKWVKIKEGGRQVTTWQVPKNKVGWHFTSALPGQPGNTVLSGHRNIYTEVFRYIVDLKPGDPITLYAGDQAFVYYVEEQHVVQEVGVPQSVREENARWIARTDDVRLTLITCAPYEAPGNTHRVIVVARP